MNFLDAAFEILKQVGRPLYYTEITTKALSNGILSTKGQTPESTMGSRLYTDVKKPNTRFQHLGQGVFTLVDKPSSDIGNRIDSINRKTKKELQKRLMEMSYDRFEVLVGELLKALGFNEETIEVTSKSNDRGVDVRGILNAARITEIKVAVQVKRWKNNVHAPVVQGLRGSLTVHEQGIIISTSKFSKGALEEAKAPNKVPISLIDGEELLKLLIEHKVGVVSNQYVVNTLDEEWWDDVAGESTKPIISVPVPPTITYPCPVEATARGQTFRAKLLDKKGRICYAGVEYRSPSGACMAATQWKTCNGWTFWRYQHPQTGEWQAIDRLRQKHHKKG